MLQDKFVSTQAPEYIVQVGKTANIQTLLKSDELAAVIVNCRQHHVNQIAGLLAQRDGAILPLITTNDSDTLIQRLLLEKTISIDTTASGGNTSLMTLEDKHD